MALDITAESLADGSTRLALSGEIDMISTRALRDAIGAALRTKHANALTIDLAEVTFIDSSGIAALVSGRNLADVCHAAYQVINAKDLVRKAFEVTGTLAYLTGR